MSGISICGYKDYQPDESWLQLKQQNLFDGKLQQYLSHERVAKQYDYK